MKPARYMIKYILQLMLLICWNRYLKGRYMIKVVLLCKRSEASKVLLSRKSEVRSIVGGGVVLDRRFLAHPLFPHNEFYAGRRTHFFKIKWKTRKGLWLQKTR
jgi:hypothetical protein